MKKRSIYKSKMNLGLSRQKVHSKTLTKLNSILEDEILELDGRHPYDFSWNLHQRLLENQVFSGADLSEFVRAKKPPEYLYRLQACGSLLFKAKEYNLIDLKRMARLNSTSDEEFMQFIFDEIDGNSKKGSLWFPLNQILTAYKPNDRNISFWTSRNLENYLNTPDGYWRTCHRLGFSNFFINDDIFLLKMKVSRPLFDRLFVPSVIHGFTEIIYTPISYDNEPHCGMTIDVKKMTLGLPEYVVSRAIVNSISIKRFTFPRVETESSRLGFAEHERVIDNLMKYFK